MRQFNNGSSYSHNGVRYTVKGELIIAETTDGDVQRTYAAYDHNTKAWRDANNNAVPQVILANLFASAPPAYDDFSYGENNDARKYYEDAAYAEKPSNRQYFMDRLPNAPSLSMPSIGYLIPEDKRTYSSALAVAFALGAWGLILYGAYYSAEFNDFASEYNADEVEGVLKKLTYGMGVAVVAGSFLWSYARQQELAHANKKFVMENKSEEISNRANETEDTTYHFNQAINHRLYAGHLFAAIFIAAIVANPETRAYASIAAVFTAFFYKLAMDKLEDKSSYIKTGKTSLNKTPAQLDQEFQENLIGVIVTLGLAGLMGYSGYISSAQGEEQTRFAELSDGVDNVVLAASIMVLVGGFFIGMQIVNRAKHEYNARAAAVDAQTVKLSTSTTPRHYENHITWGRIATVGSLIGCIVINLLKTDTSSEVYAVGQGLFALTGIFAVATAKMIEMDYHNKMQYLKFSGSEKQEAPVAAQAVRTLQV